MIIIGVIIEGCTADSPPPENNVEPTCELQQNTRQQTALPAWTLPSLGVYHHWLFYHVQIREKQRQTSRRRGEREERKWETLNSTPP